jgi:hypothetical protein
LWGRLGPLRLLEDAVLVPFFDKIFFFVGVILRLLITDQAAAPICRNRARLDSRWSGYAAAHVEEETAVKR